MKLKRTIVALASAATLLSLTSCGDKNYGDVSTKITVWATAAEEAVINKVVEEYNKKQSNDSNKFNISFKAVAESDAGTTLAKDPTVADAPALFLCADDHINNLVSLNIIASLTGSRAETIKSENSENSVLGVTNNGTIYGYPVTNDNGYFLWYDSSALSQTDVTSLETILSKAQTAGKKVLMDVANGWYANSFVMAPEACGTDSLKWEKTTNADGTTKITYTVTWDNDAGVTVSEYIATLLTKYTNNGTLITGSNDEISSGFADGSLIAAVSGTWMENDIKNSLGNNMAASKLPKFKISDKEYQMATFSGSKVYCINKTRPAAEQKVAASLAELLTNKESQLIRFETRASLPCNNEALKDSRYTDNVSVGGRALLEQISAAAAVQSQSAEDKYWDVGKTIGQAYLDSNLGEYTSWKAFLTAQLATLRS